MTGIRRSIGQARFNLLNARWVALEFGSIGLIVGVMAESWTWGIGAFFALAIGCALPIIGVLILVTISGLWGLCFFSIGFEMGGVAGSLVIGSIGTLIAFGMHLSGVQGLVDSAA